MTMAWLHWLRYKLTLCLLGALLGMVGDAGNNALHVSNQNLEVLGLVSWAGGVQLGKEEE